MFRFEYPVFEHKNILKKSMLDELRDYPLVLSRMLLKEWGNGIMEGCNITWENNVLKIHPGLLRYEGNIYRLEEEYSLSCPPADQLTYIKVRFIAMEYERNYRGGLGEICLGEEAPLNSEMELGRFRLQEGARLRTAYEGFEDYQTEFDTLIRIHVPYACVGGSGLWPRLLKEYALELMDTGTENIWDISFAMQILGAEGRIAGDLVKRYVEKDACRKYTESSNVILYNRLLHILKERKSGNSGWKRPETVTRQMVLL